jgi:hypothetical protein
MRYVVSVKINKYMKILQRKDFMDTPRGTLWSYYEPCIFRDLNVKTTDKSDYENDFVYFGLIGEFDVQDSSDYAEICTKMELGESIPASFEETTREGLFDDEQLFLVYEKEDVNNMIKVLQGIIQNSIY